MIMSQINYQQVSKLHSYWCFTLLILLQIVNTFQRASISYMYAIQDPAKLTDPHFSLRAAVPDFTDDKYNRMVGDTFTIIYAFMVLITGSISDLFNRKILLITSVFLWCACTYLSSFATTFHQLNVLRLLQSFFSSFLGPCSYSLITDWIVPQQRTMAYAVFALGVQFGGPLCPYNIDMINWLGWQASFQLGALIGFVLLGICFVSFDEPERGRFDIAHSVVNNPDESIKEGSQAFAYDLSQTRNLKI